MTPWTDTELDFLRSNYGSMNAREIGRAISRSRDSVHTMRKRLGLKMNHAQRCKACSDQHGTQVGKRNHNWKGGISRQHGRYTGRYKIANPQKVRAHIAVHSAVKRGTIQKMPCEVCGELQVQAHHDDYSKPLHVRWLCKPHHIQADNARRAKESQDGRYKDSNCSTPSREG